MKPLNSAMKNLFLLSLSFLLCLSCNSVQKEMSPIEGMRWIPAGSFSQGARPNDNMAMAHEKPAHEVFVDGFYMDSKEVSNAQFKAFVLATGYLTLAERAVDWEQMKLQLPIGTQKPADSLLMPGALTFKAAASKLPNLYDFSQWWQWTLGANWRQPQGPGSTIEGRESHPVVQIAYQDALAYCEWAGRSLPTEAQWEYAARGGLETIYSWGADASLLKDRANSWEGSFPDSNLATDGYENTAPTASYPPNNFGLYDMSGNVWEWTQDWYHAQYYTELSLNTRPVENPLGAEKAYNPNNPYTHEKVIKGGSFLCNAAYCASYRASARMASDPDSSAEHIGFRTVLNVAPSH